MARPRSDIAPRVLEAARRRFLVEGVDGASLRGIADDAGTSIGMVYYYFPTKDDLFLAAVEEVYLALLRDLEQVVHRGLPVRARLLGLYRRLGAATAIERQVLSLVLREGLTSPGRLVGLLGRFRRGHIPLLIGLVRDGVAEGLLAPGLPVPLVLAAIMSLGGPGQVMLWAMGDRLGLPAVPAPEEAAEALLGILLGGVGQQAPPRSRTRGRRAPRAGRVGRRR
jgi:AcrR family transcriptional regulator